MDDCSEISNLKSEIALSRPLPAPSTLCNRRWPESPIANRHAPLRSLRFLLFNHHPPRRRQKKLSTSEPFAPLAYLIPWMTALKSQISNPKSGLPAQPAAAFFPPRASDGCRTSGEPLSWRPGRGGKRSFLAVGWTERPRAGPWGFHNAQLQFHAGPPCLAAVPAVSAL